MTPAARRTHWLPDAGAPPACGKKPRIGKPTPPELLATEDEAAVTCERCLRLMAWQEKQGMQAWCGPGQSVQEMLARAAERDS